VEVGAGVSVDVGVATAVNSRVSAVGAGVCSRPITLVPAMTAWLSPLAAGAQPTINAVSERVITNSEPFIDVGTPSPDTGLYLMENYDDELYLI
jgi:hypothetical protein